MLQTSSSFASVREDLMLSDPSFADRERCSKHPYDLFNWFYLETIDPIRDLYPTRPVYFGGSVENQSLRWQGSGDINTAISLGGILFYEHGHTSCNFPTFGRLYEYAVERLPRK
jgi:hypothetical protein